MKYPPLVEKILHPKGLKEEEKEVFLQKKFHLKDPFEFTQMKTIVKRLEKAIQEKETIGIYGDFDCDGVPATAILTKALYEYGVNPAVYIPDIHTETHGFHKKGADTLKEKNASIILVVDCGINDHETVSYIQEKGVDVIILDHHTPEGTSPAFAVFNPLLENDATPYCGAGCAWKVVSALYTHTKQKEGKEKWLLDIAGIATISDRVPLIKENRILVHYGLIVLKKTRNKGIIALCAYLKIKNIDQEIVEMRILPFLNNALRMGLGMGVHTLLTSNDEEEIQHCIVQCEKKNKEFRSTTSKIIRHIKQTAKTKKSEKPIWVFGDREWSSAFTGIIAQKIASEYKKTIFIWGVNRAGEINGSARTALCQNVLDLMKKTHTKYSIYGGHIYAAGFTAHQHTPLTLEEALNDIPFKIEEKTKNNMFQVDLSDITPMETLTHIYNMGPFGTKNERPIFEIRGTPTQTRIFGKTRKHLSYILSDGNNTIEVVKLYAKETMPVGEEICIKGVVDFNTYLNNYYIKEVHSM